jgi:hypothetical protein
VIIKRPRPHVRTVRNIFFLKLNSNQKQNRGGEKKQAAAGKQAVKKDKSPTGKKSPAKGKKTGAAAGGPLPDIDKQSQLKRKEDIEDEEKYLDDEPRDGPHHYIILSGFYSANLLNYIDEFNLPLDCLVRFRSANSELIKKFITEIDEREKLETNLKTNLKINGTHFNRLMNHK